MQQVLYLLQTKKMRENNRNNYYVECECDLDCGLRRILLLTHTDMDGYCPEVIANYYFIDQLERHCLKTKHISNEDMDTVIKETIESELCYDDIYIVDISCSTETAEQIDHLPEDIKKRIHLFDHHRTAIELNKYSWATVVEELNGTKVSASRLFYDYLTDNFSRFSGIHENPTLKNLVYQVSNYDTWEWVRFNDELPKKLNTLFVLQNGEAWTESMIDKVYKQSNLISPEEIELIKRDAENSKAYCEKTVSEAKMYTYDFNGQRYQCVVCKGRYYMADLFDAMKITYPECDIWMQYFGNTISMRSIDENVNVAEIAKHFGGGGHKHAAGFSVPFMEIVEFMMNR